MCLCFMQVESLELLGLIDSRRQPGEAATQTPARTSPSTCLRVPVRAEVLVWWQGTAVQGCGVVVGTSAGRPRLGKGGWSSQGYE